MFKSGEVFGEIIEYHPNGMVDIDYLGTIVTLPESENELKKSGSDIRLLAPNGQPSNLPPAQYAIVRTPAFKAWFGDWEKLARVRAEDSGIDDVTLANLEKNVSKIVDENGEPMVVFHGTNEEFNEFDVSKTGWNTGNYGHHGYGAYFSFDKREAAGYGKTIFECFAKAIKPFTQTEQNFMLLRQNGIDWLPDIENVGIDFESVYTQMLAKDAVAAYLMKCINQAGFEKGWELFFEKYTTSESPLDLNDITDLMEYVNNRNGVPDYIESVIKSLNLDYSKVKFIKGYSNSLSLVYNVTHLGERSKEFTETIKQLGFDAVEAGSELVLFKPTQIKLANGNTTFDASNPDVRLAKGGMVNRKELINSPEFKKWFKKSVVVDGRGQPKIMYHGTRKDFSVFDISHAGKTTHHETSALGFFFTGIKIAQSFAYPTWDESDVSLKSEFYEIRGKQLGLPHLLSELKNMRYNYFRYNNINSKIARKEDRIDREWNSLAHQYSRKIDFGSGANLMPVYLSIQKPFEMTAEQILSYGSFDRKKSLPTAEQTRKKLIEQGYDGILIKKHPDLSEFEFETYVAFYPEQIKSVFNTGAFDSSNPDVRLENGGSAEIFDKIYWHGSDKKIKGEPKLGRSDSVIKTKMGGIPFRDLWNAFYVTDEKGWAEFFSPQTKSVYGVQLKKNAKIIDLSDVAAESTHLKNKAFLGGQNIKSDFPFQKEFDAYAFDWINKAREKNGRPALSKEEFIAKDLQSSFRPTHKNWFLDDLGPEAFADYVKDKGYDAVKFGREIAILNPDIAKFTEPEYQIGGSAYLIHTPAFKAWFGTSKVVDESGEPLLTYRGQHGVSGEIESRLPAYSQVPNNQNKDSIAIAPKVVAGYLSIQNPVINTPDDPFIDFSVIIGILGIEKAYTIAEFTAPYIYGTDNWNENFESYKTIAQLKKENPTALSNVYVDAYPVFDNPEFVGWFAEKGYDGVIHGGAGVSLQCPEYKVFDKRQIMPVPEQMASGGEITPDTNVALTTADKKVTANILTGPAETVLSKLVRAGVKFDCVFLDPAYFSRALLGGNRGIKQYGFIYPPEFNEVMNDVKLLMRNKYSHCYLMLAGSQSAQVDMEMYLTGVLEAGFKIVENGSYQKLFSNGKPVTNVRGKVAEPERLLVLSLSGKIKPENIISEFSFVRPSGYQSEKAPGLLKQIIEQSTTPGQTVLDAFAGSGVAGEQAILAGRNVFLIEKNETVVESLIIPRVTKAIEQYNLEHKPEGQLHLFAKGGKIDNEVYQKWKSLVNMTSAELEKFYNSEDGKAAGLSSAQAKKLGIHYGRESARWIMRMKNTPVEKWTPEMWEWANRQIRFNSRMLGNKGPLYDANGQKTRKHTSLLIWGHNPEKYAQGGNLRNVTFYHGSGVKGISKLGETPFHRGGDSFATWFTNSRPAAEKFSTYFDAEKNKPEKGQVYEANLDIRNPLIIEWDNFEKEYFGAFKKITGVDIWLATKDDSIKFRNELKKQGYDAIVFKNVNENGIESQTYVAVFDTSQINMADGILDKTYIHETHSPITSFNLDNIGTGQGDQWLGRGIYFQEKGGFKLENYGPEKIEITLKPNAKIFEVEETKHGKYRDTFVEWAVKNELAKNKLAEIKEFGLNFKNLLPRDILKRNPAAVEKLLAAGYDGLYQDGELVIYNPEVIKLPEEAKATGGSLKQVKVFYHGVKKSENVKEIIKNGFDLHKINPLWQNDLAVSVLNNPRHVTDFFGREVPILKITFSGVIVRHEDLPPILAQDAWDYTKQILALGIDAVKIGRHQTFIYNVKAISKIEI